MNHNHNHNNVDDDDSNDDSMRAGCSEGSEGYGVYMFRRRSNLNDPRGSYKLSVRQNPATKLRLPFPTHIKTKNKKQTTKRVTRGFDETTC